MTFNRTASFPKDTRGIIKFVDSYPSISSFWKSDIAEYSICADNMPRRLFEHCMTIITRSPLYTRSTDWLKFREFHFESSDRKRKGICIDYMSNANESSTNMMAYIGDKSGNFFTKHTVFTYAFFFQTNSHRQTSLSKLYAHITGSEPLPTTSAKQMFELLSQKHFVKQTIGNKASFKLLCERDMFGPHVNMTFNFVFATTFKTFDLESAKDAGNSVRYSINYDININHDETSKLQRRLIHFAFLKTSFKTLSTSPTMDMMRSPMNSKVLLMQCSQFVFQIRNTFQNANEHTLRKQLSATIELTEIEHMRTIKILRSAIGLDSHVSHTKYHIDTYSKRYQKDHQKSKRYTIWTKTDGENRETYTSLYSETFEIQRKLNIVDEKDAHVIFIKLEKQEHHNEHPSKDHNEHPSKHHNESDDIVFSYRLCAKMEPNFTFTVKTITSKTTSKKTSKKTSNDKLEKTYELQLDFIPTKQIFEQKSNDEIAMSFAKKIIDITALIEQNAPYEITNVTRVVHK